MKPIFACFVFLLTVNGYTNEKILPGGCMQIPGEEGRTLPLLHTNVKATIEGILAQTTLTQMFRNDTSNTLELTYIFPMPHRAAIGHYQFKIGDRTITGTIQTKAKAREMYEQARQQGKTAALLEQQRPNIFTQDLTNIPAGAQIEVQISYSEIVTTNDAKMTWVLPTVVGPRFMPEQSQDTQITNPVYQWPQSRPANTLSIEIELMDEGNLGSIASPTHSVIVQRGKKTKITLDGKRTIPNKDFVLSYTFTNKLPEIMIASHFEGSQSGQNTFLATILPPSPQSLKDQIMPREFFFILDVSGSMFGQPLDKAVATIKSCMSTLRPQDTFQIMTFAGSTAFFKPTAVHPTAENLSQAMVFLNSRQSGGGTYMLQAINSALGIPLDPERYRMAIMFTDGYIGNEKEIITEIGRLKNNSRFFAFGIGTSVNRYLIEAMGRAGNGFSEFVALNEDLSQTARRWENRLRSPVLTDLQVELSGLRTSDILPDVIPDLFAGEPILVSGHFTGKGVLSLSLKGKQGSKPYEKVFSADLSKQQNPEIARIWAREKVRDLNFARTMPERVANDEDLISQITQLGLNYRLMTEFTSFVAIDSQSQVPTENRIHSDVPVSLPEGVSPRMLGGSHPKKGFIRTMAQAPTPSRSMPILEKEVKAKEESAKDDSFVSSLMDEVKITQKPNQEARAETIAASLIFNSGNPSPIGVLVTGTQTSDWVLRNAEGSISIRVKPEWFKKMGPNQIKLLFSQIKELTKGTWVLKHGENFSFQFTL